MIVTGRADFAHRVTGELARHHVLVADLRLEQRTFDDAYLALIDDPSTRLVRQGPGGLEMRELAHTALRTMTRTEAKLFVREPLNVFLILALPVLLVVGFGLIPGFGEPNEFLGGQSGTEFIASLGIGIVLAVLGFSILPTVLGSYRERGILKRLHASPVTPATLLLAQFVVVGAAALVAVVLMVGVGMAAFGLALPRNLPFFLLAVLLGAAALLSVGLLIAAVAPSSKAATAIGMLAFFPSMFLGGVYIPREAFPGAPAGGVGRDPARRRDRGDPGRLAGGRAPAGPPRDNGRVGGGGRGAGGADVPVGVTAPADPLERWQALQRYIPYGGIAVGTALTLVIRDPDWPARPVALGRGRGGRAVGVADRPGRPAGSGCRARCSSSAGPCSRPGWRCAARGTGSPCSSATSSRSSTCPAGGASPASPRPPRWSPPARSAGCRGPSRCS